MEKSQLRRLALDHADGHIAAEAYRTRRRRLIDGIVDGSVPIEREPSAATPADPFAVTAATGRSGKPRVSWPLALAGGSAVCAAVVIALLLWPADEPPPAAVPAPAPDVPAVELSPARVLVESFIARRNFAGDAVAAFEAGWTALAPADRDEARSSLWFASLVRALRDEVKTQKALAGLAGGDAALERARRIVALGTALGIADRLPDVDDAGAQDLERLSPTAAGQPTPELPPAIPTTPTGRTAAPGDDVTLTGREWLARQADGALTLQLFAVNGLDRVEQLMANHPELSVRILATDGASPRYRVFHGVFADAAAARSAFEALPGEITGASHGAIVKSFAAVRDDLAGRPSEPGETAAVAPAGDFTLQLFASGSRTNAESLVQTFPALGLELRQRDGDPVPFRVVYGRFDSVDAARAASAALPADLLSKVGTPLPKPVAETGTPPGP